MPSSESCTVDVPARSGGAVLLRGGDCVRVVDTEGGQVGDLFAFAAGDLREHLSAAHTRGHLSRLFPLVGQSFVTNRRRPILTLRGDTSPGCHDMLVPACDPARYVALGHSDHASCEDNLRTVLSGLGHEPPPTPQPVNVFMNTPVTPEGVIEWLAARSRAGDFVALEAEMDCVVVVSACPQDLNAINRSRPSGLTLQVFAADGEGSGATTAHDMSSAFRAR